MKDGPGSSRIKPIKFVGRKIITEELLGYTNSKYDGAVLGPSGRRVCFVSHYATRVIELDIDSLVVMSFGEQSGDWSKWSGGVNAPDGFVYCASCNSSEVLIFEPRTKQVLIITLDVSNITPIAEGKYVTAVIETGEAKLETKDEAKDDVPDELCCPLSCEIMEDPVVAADGHTYERAMIEQWLREHSTSPKTNSPLPYRQLTTNMNIQRLIMGYHDGKKQ